MRAKKAINRAAKPRDPEKEKKRRASKALRRVKRLSAQANQSGADFSEWETEFLESLEERLEEYGAAFRDPEKGAVGAPLSYRQSQKMKEIGAKAKPSGGLKRSGLSRSPHVSKAKRSGA